MRGCIMPLLNSPVIFILVVLLKFVYEDYNKRYNTLKSGFVVCARSERVRQYFTYRVGSCIMGELIAL